MKNIKIKIYENYKKILKCEFYQFFDIPPSICPKKKTKTQKIIMSKFIH